MSVLRIRNRRIAGHWVRRRIPVGRRIPSTTTRFWAGALAILITFVGLVAYVVAHGGGR